MYMMKGKFITDPVTTNTLRIISEWEWHVYNKMGKILFVISVSTALKKPQNASIKRTLPVCRWETASIVRGDCAVCLVGKLL